MKIINIFFLLSLVLLSSCSEIYKTSIDTSCSSHDDCKLVFTQCGCFAANIKENPVIKENNWISCEPSCGGVSVCSEGTCVLNYDSNIELTEEICDGKKIQKEKDTCINIVAKNLKDEKLCNKASGIMGEHCYSNVALIKKNMSICYNIPEDSKVYMRERCFGDIMEESNFSVCAGLKTMEETDDSSGIYKETCYEKFAEKEKDESICNNIDGIKEGCYVQVAIQKEDVDLCKSFEESWARDGCYQGIALISGKENKELCIKIEENQTRDMCYYNIAVRSNDKMICDMIIEDETISNCKREIDYRTV